MMVRLLGRPAIERGGVRVTSPRGNKTWALLTYLALADVPPSRQRLVTLLFDEADDPRRTLRWNLAELRRALDGVISVAGNPVRLEIAEGNHVDALLVTRRTTGPDLPLAALGGELLEGMAFDDCPCFEAWLAAERHRLAADCRALVCESALRLLASGAPADAAVAAARAVELDPFNADYHTVLVTCLARAGDTKAARHHVARCTDLFRRELGVDPPADVALAAQPARRAPPNHVSGAATVRSYLDAGNASLSAGAVALGIRQLRDAVIAALAGDTVVDEHLAGRAQLALGSALIHSAGGRGAEVATLLHEALAAAERAGDATTAVAACRELAFLGVQLGQHDGADHWLRRAEDLCVTGEELARVSGVRGMSLTDRGDYVAALVTLTASVEHAERAGARRQRAWSQSMIGRIHVLRGEPSLAAAVLDEALEVVRAQRWMAFLPWPEAFRAEAAIEMGDDESASDLLEHAWVLASEMNDHCWITTVAHGFARLTSADEPHRALAWCRAGLQPRPWYLWPRARLLDAGCGVAARLAPELARQWAAELTEISGRGAMRELIARARLRHAQFGDRTAMAVARDAAFDVDNPILRRLFATEGAVR